MCVYVYTGGNHTDAGLMNQEYYDEDEGQEDTVLSELIQLLTLCQYMYMCTCTYLKTES